LTKLKLHS